MFTSAQVFLLFRSEYKMYICSCTGGKKQVLFSMAIGNVELMHKCFPKKMGLGTARIKQDKETKEECKKIGVRIETSKAGPKEKETPTSITT